MEKELAPVLRALSSRVDASRQRLTLDDLESVARCTDTTLHLAVMREPYLERVIRGDKRVESRMTTRRLPPYGAIARDEVVLFKLAGGAIAAAACVRRVESFEPRTRSDLLNRLTKYSAELSLEADFLEQKGDSRFVTLISLGPVQRVGPWPMLKKGRQAWVVVSPTADEARSPGRRFKRIGDKIDHRHVFSLRTSHSRNTGQPLCEICRDPVIDWDRVRRCDRSDREYLMASLRSEQVREDYWTTRIDDEAVSRVAQIRFPALPEFVQRRLKTSVGRVAKTDEPNARPYRDGMQTPRMGNVIYYAQHATASCCRRCIRMWHGVPYGRDLTTDELSYLVDLVMFFLRERWPEIESQTENAVLDPP